MFTTHAWEAYGLIYITFLKQFDSLCFDGLPKLYFSGDQFWLLVSGQICVILFTPIIFTPDTTHIANFSFCNFLHRLFQS